jgi:hypothetical protein
MNEYRKRSDGAILTEQQVRDSVPDVGLPAVLDVATLDSLDLDPVLPSPQPYATSAQVVFRNGVVQDANGNWIWDWNIQDLDANVVKANADAAVLEFKKEMTRRVQERLDLFAATRGYGDDRTSPTVSIATYIGSVVPKFAMEAEYFRNQRDLTWAKLYQIDAEVTAGTRPAPHSYEEIEAELPKLKWPDDTTPDENAPNPIS